MARVNIDGRDYDLPDGQNLLHACLSERLDLPYFCWHPAMGSVGSCRLCAVLQYRDEADTRGRLQMACMMTVEDGLRIGIGTSDGEASRPAAFAADFRKQVIEWLMENHPHDCPVCEEGGECHLQDMTVMTGHSMRRYAGMKRTWVNQYLGPFVGHEMNRCITCYRCVRYYRDYAGGTDLDAFGSKSHMFFGRAEDGVLESEFAGNLVEVCPTGVFTDKPFSKVYTRKWDLQSAPSICPHCSVGCNTFPAERYGVLKRVHNRYHGEVNGYFLCDRGRYGSHFVNHDRRIRNAGVRAEDGVFEAPGRDAAVTAVAERLQDADVIGIGSPRASMGANFALKELVGADNFCIGMADDEAATMAAMLDAYRGGGFKIPSLTDIETADAVLILGEDISNTAARMALAVRQAARGVAFEMAKDAEIPDWQDAGVRGHAQHAKSPLYIASVASTRIDDLAAATRHGDALDLARAGFGIAHAIDSDFPPGTLDAFVASAAEALAAADRPLVIAGSEAREPALVQAATNIALALGTRGEDAMLALTASESNSYGAALLGGSLGLSDAVQRIADGAVAVIVENDLYRRLPGDGVDLGRAIVMDYLETPTAESSAVVLPASTYAEQTGTFVNYETRAQRFYQVFEPTDEIAPSWRWISAIGNAMGRDDLGWTDMDSLTKACAAAGVELSGLADVAPGAGFRVDAESKIPRQPHRYSGRTAMRANVSVHEPKTTVDHETPFSYSMEGLNTGDQPGAVLPYVWSPGWNSNQSVFKFQQEVAGALAGGDPGARLIVANGDTRKDAHQDVPPPAQTDLSNGTFVAAHVSYVFGGDELSAASAPILERTPPPYVLLNSADAQRLGVSEGNGVAIAELGASYEVRVDDGIAPGVAGVARGLPGTGVLTTTSVNLAADPDFVRRPGGDPNLIAKG
ncbi:MAG: NADH-quinone oxidoreductase subunit NuoG [Gammaproteobacteria bacterium]|nr:NADH-quinone oxidoreductase subunit NuoG [Gammaproteobacteria bacterium]